MYKTFPLLLLIIPPICLSSCKQKNNPETNIVVPISLVSDSIRVNEVFELDDWMLYNNHLIIRSNRTDTLIFIYNLPDFTFKGKYISKGSGPEELLFPRFIKNNHVRDHVYIFDNGSSTLSIYKLEKEGLIVKNIYSPATSADRILMDESFMVNENTFLVMESSPYDITIKTFGLDEHFYYKINEQKLHTNLEGNSSLYESYLSSDGEFIVQAYLKQNQIITYESRNNSIEKRHELTSHTHVEDEVFYYTEVCIHNDHIYALY